MKAVIFDFDGTLTQKKEKLWKKIWQVLEYDVGQDSYYVRLYKNFMNGEISHKEWCKLTCKAFQEKGFNKRILDDITDNMKLMNGAENLIKYLYSKGIEIYIVSGNIISVIEKVLAKNRKYISEIKANEFEFDQFGNLTEIIGTKYDFEGKANFIKELCKQKGFIPSEILFIGNSHNDEWVYQSGAKTICVNPDDTDSENNTIWNKVINTDNLLDLEKEI